MADFSCEVMEVQDIGMACSKHGRIKKIFTAKLYFKIEDKLRTFLDKQKFKKLSGTLAYTIRNAKRSSSISK